MSRRLYSDDFRESVVDAYKRVGLRAAERETGVDRSTILRWVKEAGVDREAVVLEVSERNRRAGMASAARIERDRLAARERVLNRVIRVSEAAATRELELLAKGGFEREDLQAVTNARQKAIQQFELLEGRATARTDSLVDAESLLAAVGVAFNAVLELVGPDLRDAVSERFALELREARELSLAALEAGDVEDGELVVEDEEAAA